MAASNDPPTPGSQLLYSSNAYDDEWRQIEDELPTLIASDELSEQAIVHYLMPCG